METIPNIDDIYKNYEILANSASSDTEKSDAYSLILKGLNGGDKEKRLSSQFLARFFKAFPAQQDATLERLFDLCMDEDGSIRKQVIHDLSIVCKAEPANTARVAYILVQMLLTDDQTEHHSVHLSLSHLLQLDSKATLSGIFNQIISDKTADSVRESSLRFLVDKIKMIPEAQMKPDLEEFIIEKTKEVLKDASEEEFHQMLSIMSSLKSMSTVTGRQKLVDMISDQALQARPVFEPTDASCVAHIMESGKQAAQFVSKNVHAGGFLTYLLDQVVPRLSSIPDHQSTTANTNSGSGEAGEDAAASPQLTLLRVLAELSAHPGPALPSTPADQMAERLGKLYTCFIDHLPKHAPNLEEEAASETAKSAVKNGDDAAPKEADKPAAATEEKPQEKKPTVDEEQIRLSEVECLLFAFHQLGRYHPEFLTENAERGKELRQRLQYLAHQAQRYSKSLGEELAKSKPDDLRKGQNKLRVVAYKVTSNIHNLIRDLFKNPPTYKAVVVLSWVGGVAGVKRANVDDIDSGVVTQKQRQQPSQATGGKQDRATYRPPVGRWSDREQGNRGRGGYRGGVRGRGGGWGRRW